MSHWTRFSSIQLYRRSLIFNYRRNNSADRQNAQLGRIRFRISIRLSTRSSIFFPRNKEFFFLLCKKKKGNKRTPFHLQTNGVNFFSSSIWEIQVRWLNCEKVDIRGRGKKFVDKKRKVAEKKGKKRESKMSPFMSVNLSFFHEQLVCGI